MKLYAPLNLSLFDGEAGGGSAGAAPAASAGTAQAPAPKPKPEKNPLATVRYGKQPAPEQPAPAEAETAVTSDTKEARRAEFERLVQGEYKDLYDERTQQILADQRKQAQALEAQASQAKALAPVLELLAGKYGVDASDVQALAKAIQEDDSYYEEEAAEKGLSVAQLKEIKRIERENAQFKRAAQERERQANAERVYAKWQQQADACQRMYPGFDLAAECAGESGTRFMDLLRSGVDVQTAYEVVHKDELIGGAMQYTAKTISQKVTNDIRARGLRPPENGGGNGAAVTVKTDPRTFTRKDREEIARRVMRGERIEL